MKRFNLILLFFAAFSVQNIFAPNNDNQNDNQTDKERLIPYLKNGLWGYCTQDKKIIIAPQFEEAQFFDTDSSANGEKLTYANVKINGKYGAISPKGDFIVPAMYLMPVFFRGGMGIIFNTQLQEKNAEKLIIINYKNEKIFSSTKNLDLYREMTDGLQGLSLSGEDYRDAKLGFIDAKGKTIIPFVYDPISPVSDGQFQNGRAVLFKNGKLGIIDKKNKIILPFTIQNASPSGHEIAKDGSAKIGLMNGEVLLINPAGKIIGKEKITNNPARNIPSSENLIKNISPKNPSYIGAFDYFLADKNGKKLSSEVYSEISEFKFGDKNTTQNTTQAICAIAKKTTGKMDNLKSFEGIIDANGKEVVPFIYYQIYECADKIVLKTKNGLCGILNAKTLKIHAPCVYNEYLSCNMKNNTVLMRKFANNKDMFFVVNEKGEEKQVAEDFNIFHSSDFNEPNKEMQLFLAKKEDKYTFLNDDFVPVFGYYDFMFFNIYLGGQKFLQAQKKGKKGILNYKNEIIVPFEYDEINSANLSNEDLFWITKNGKSFYVKFPTLPNMKVIEYAD